MKNAHFATHDTIFCGEYIMAIRDGSPEARMQQLRIQQSMSGEQRLLLAFEMSIFARELGRERIRVEHPHWSEGQIARELLRLAFLPKPLPNLQ